MTARGHRSIARWCRTSTGCVTLLLATVTGCQEKTTVPTASNSNRASEQPATTSSVASSTNRRGSPANKLADEVSERVRESAVPASTPASPPPASPVSSATPRRRTFRVLTDPRPLYKPQVALSSAHQQTCLVSIGDPFPALDLPDVSGRIRDWKEVLGPNLTVVVVWSSRSVFSVEQVSRLEREATDLYQGAGVHVVAMNVGDTVEKMTEWTQGGETPVVHLLDTNGAAFEKLATRHMPRTYLLDSDGRIVWLDIEYSQTTRRDLENAVRYFLKNPPRTAPL
ncbi:MAG: hypothetical protein RIS70_4350 [Planctomycetota bacterium]